MPPLRSIRSMRRICRKRRLRSDVARTLPWLPTATTGTEAISTKMSGREHRQRAGDQSCPGYNEATTGPVCRHRVSAKPCL